MRSQRAVGTEGKAPSMKPSGHRRRGRPGVVGATLLFPAALLGAALPARAQVPDSARADSVYRIPDLTIRASRPVTTVGGAGAIEVSPDSLRLPPAPSVGEVLREIPAVHVRTNSRGQAEISVRGSESRQVAVLVDGIPLTLGWDARTDVSVLPATAPQQITLVRGLSSILYGPNVLGGIVEMSVAESRVPHEETSVQVAGGADHVGGVSTSATVTVPFEGADGRWLLRAGGGYRDSPGDPLADGVTEPVPTEDGLRLNTDVSHLDGFFSLRYEADGGAWFSTTGSAFRAERGIAAELGVSEPRLWRYPHISRTIAVVSAGTGHRATPLGRGDLELSVGLDRGRTQIDEYTSRAYEETSGFENGDDRTWTVRLLGDHTLGPRADLRAAFTFADILHDENIDGSLATYQQRLWSLGGETIVRLVEPDGGPLSSLRLSLGAALDRATTPQSGGRPPLDGLTDWGARAGVTAVLSEGDLLLHAGASRRARFPALRELYSEALDRFEPNPDLGPERLVALEAGATARVGRGELQAVGFHHRLSGAIRRILLESGRRRRVNADELRSTGLELLASQDLGPLGLSGDLILQSVELIDPATSESTEPENLPELEWGLEARVPFASGFRATLGARFTGSQFCLDPDTGGDRRLDGGAWLHAGLSRAFSLGSERGATFSGLEVSAFGENLGDVVLYDQCGLPRPGRLVGLRVRLY